MRALLVCCMVAALPALGASAPNRVDITPRLSTSGQPDRAFLESLKAAGFEVVVYLAPPTVGDAIAEEPLIVGKQRLIYVNVPIAFGAPTAADFEAVSAVLRAFANRKVYVHCQANFRASSMVFLHRVIHGKENPEAAWKSVRDVWVPDRVWRAFIVDTLKAHHVAFDPL